MKTSCYMGCPVNDAVFVEELDQATQNASFQWFLEEVKKRSLWMELLSVREEDVKPSTWVCSRHLIPDGDVSKSPSATLGEVCFKACKGERGAKNVACKVLGTNHNTGVTVQLQQSV